MIIANLISFILVIVGGLNWGLVGIFGWNMVEAIFGGYNVGSIIVYVLACLASLWLIISAFIYAGKIVLWRKNGLSDNMNDKKQIKNQENID